MKRELQRHSVEKDVKGFCGWPIMQKITESAKSVGADPLRDSGFIAASFSTGGKASEVLALTPSMFSVVKGCKPWLVVVKDMPLLKRYQKTGESIDSEGKRHYETKRVEAMRDFSFRIDEPMWEPLARWLIYALKREYEWLFPSPYKHGYPLSRKWGFWLVQKIADSTDLPIHPHWFGAQRASQLASEYDFSESSLLEWRARSSISSPTNGMLHVQRPWKRRKS